MLGAVTSIGTIDDAVGAVGALVLDRVQAGAGDGDDGIRERTVAPSRLEVIPGAPLIVTVASPLYHPLTTVPGGTTATTAEMPPVGAGSVTGSMFALLLITPTFPF